MGCPKDQKQTIPAGGQIDPISIAGDKLEWKKAQKKAKKNITSDKIKKGKTNF